MISIIALNWVLLLRPCFGERHLKLQQVGTDIDPLHVSADQSSIIGEIGTGFAAAPVDADVFVPWPPDLSRACTAVSSLLVIPAIDQ